jgi:hypothetical protein
LAVFVSTPATEGASDSTLAVSAAGNSGCTKAGTWPRDARRGGSEAFAAVVAVVVVVVVFVVIAVAIASVIAAEEYALCPVSKAKPRAGDDGSEENEATETPTADSCADAASLSDEGTRAIAATLALESALALIMVLALADALELVLELEL